MNNLSGNIFLIALGIAMITWDIHDIKKNKKENKNYSPMSDAMPLSGFALGAALILGGLIRIIVSL